MFCYRCGKPLPDGSSYCEGCGTAVAQRNPYPVYTGPKHEDLSAPLKMTDYLIMFLLMWIPVANIVLLFIWGFGSNVNINKKNFSKAYLIVIAAGTVLYLICLIIFFVFFYGLISAMNYSYYY